MASGGIDVTPGRILGDEEIVTPDKLNDIGQPVLRVQAGAITTRELADGSISSDKLDVDLEAQLGVADGSVTTDKIVDEAVTIDKIEETARIPVGVIMDYAGSSAPTGWLLCYGQNVSRATFSDLFLVIGIGFGPGNGTTTFTLPDCRGRAVAGKDDMGGSSANRLTTPINGDTLGAAGGAQSHALTIAELASHQHAVGQQAVVAAGGNYVVPSQGGTLNYNDIHAGGNAAHNNVQPTIVLNKIIRH